MQIYKPVSVPHHQPPYPSGRDFKRTGQLKQRRFWIQRYCYSWLPCSAPSECIETATLGRDHSHVALFGKPIPRSSSHPRGEKSHRLLPPSLQGQVCWVSYMCPAVLDSHLWRGRAVSEHPIPFFRAQDGWYKMEQLLQS